MASSETAAEDATDAPGECLELPLATLLGAIEGEFALDPEPVAVSPRSRVEGETARAEGELPPPRIDGDGARADGDRDRPRRRLIV